MKFNNQLLKLSKSAKLLTFVMLSLLTLSSCERLIGLFPEGGHRDPDKSHKVHIDRFSDSAGILFKRSDLKNSFPNPDGYPKPNEPINFDKAPFITHGFSTSGEHVTYYNFDAHAMGVHTDVIYHFYHENDLKNQVVGQLAVVNSIPGDKSYNDFWQVVNVIVPNHYVANTIASEDGIFKSKFKLVPTDDIVNCPIVPEGSTASLRIGGGSTGLTKGWYKNQICFYFTFLEAPLKGTITASGADVSFDDIYVFFAINPDMPGGGPGSGFKVESNTMQAHNLVASVPGDAAYSPLWSVTVLDNKFFNSVKTEKDAMAHILAGNVALVNCPEVAISK